MPKRAKKKKPQTPKTIKISPRKGFECLSAAFCIYSDESAVKVEDIHILNLRAAVAASALARC